MAVHFPGGEVIARRGRISVVCGCLEGGAGEVVDDSWLVRERSAAVSHGDGPEICVRLVYGDQSVAGGRQLASRVGDGAVRSVLVLLGGVQNGKASVGGRGWGVRLD